jgi:hypothetical protein
MSAIQIVLVTAAILWLGRFLRGPGGGAAARFLALAATLSGIVLILVPELSVKLAARFGVTRGVDLVLYLSIVALGFLWLNERMRIQELESRLARLVRELALRESATPAGEQQAPPETR